MASWLNEDAYCKFNEPYLGLSKQLAEIDTVDVEDD